MEGDCMFKNNKILRNIVIGILLMCTAYLMYSLISDPFGSNNIMLALAVTAGFIIIEKDTKDKS